MRKAFSRLLYLTAIVLAVIGGFLLSHAYADGVVLPNGALHPSNVTTAVFGIIVASLACVLALAAWVGALFKMAHLHRWGWFICLLLFSGITMLLYIFFGPTTSTYPSMPVTTPPYGGFGD